MVYYRRRLDKLRKLYPDSLFIFKDNVSRTYLTGFRSSEDGDGILTVFPDHAELHIDSRYIEDAKKGIKEAKVILASTYAGAFSDIAERMSKLSPKNVIFDPDRITYSGYRNLRKVFSKIKMKPVPGLLSPLRVIKDNEEIAKITRAVEIAEKAFYETIKSVKPGISEKDLEAELEYQIKSAGGERSGFEIISLFGPRASLPHGVPSRDVKCREKEIILLDFGAVYEHYNADITRTFFLGQPTQKMKEVYLTVLRANQSVIEKVKKDVSFKKVDEIARKEIISAGYGKYFTHSLGHGLGLEVHEQPWLSPRAARGRLKPGMVFTDEPGIYLPNEFGVRIEDDLLITDGGAVALSSGITKELTII